MNTYNSQCKRMSEGMIQNAKKCLKNLTKCEEMYSSEDPLDDFGKAIMNYYQHYTDDHSSTWCRFHKKVTNLIIALYSNLYKTCECSYHFW